MPHWGEEVAPTLCSRCAAADAAATSYLHVLHIHTIVAEFDNRLSNDTRLNDRSYWEHLPIHIQMFLEQANCYLPPSCTLSMVWWRANVLEAHWVSDRLWQYPETILWYHRPTTAWTTPIWYNMVVGYRLPHWKEDVLKLSELVV
jgi:hypothetical protein